MNYISENSIYLSGPISSLTHDEALKRFSEAKHLVLSCVRPEAYDSIWIANPMDYPTGKSWNHYMRIGISDLVRCDAIVLLDGWHKSAGAMLEKDIASKLDITIYYEDSLRSLLKKQLSLLKKQLGDKN